MWNYIWSRRNGFHWQKLENYWQILLFGVIFNENEVLDRCIFFSSDADIHIILRFRTYKMVQFLIEIHRLMQFVEYAHEVDML